MTGFRRCRSLLFFAIRASTQWPVNLELFPMSFGVVMQRGFKTGKMETI